MAVLTIEKKTYAIELIWRIAEEARGSPRDLARAEAKDLGGDLYAVREGETLILALGDTKRGHRSGMPVLAFALLDQFVGSVLAAFRTPSGVYVLGTRDDMVISGVETLYQDETDARSVVRDLSQRSSWNRIIAPKDWNIPESEEILLGDVLADAVVIPKLRPIAKTREYLAFAGFLVLFVAALGVWWRIEQERFEQFLREQNLRLFAEQAEREERRRRAQTQAFPAPSWAGKRSFAASLAVCLDGARGIPVHVPGWVHGSIECVRGDTLRVTYNRQGASVTMFDVVLAGLSQPPRMTWQGNQVTLEWPLSLGTGTPRDAWRADAQTTRLADARQQLSRRIEDMGIYVYQIADQRGSPVSILSPEGEPTTAVLEQGLKISFSATLQELPLLLRLGEGHVTTLETLSLDPMVGAFRVEFMVHERLGVPGLSVPGVPRPAQRS